MIRKAVVTLSYADLVERLGIKGNPRLVSVFDTLPGHIIDGAALVFEIKDEKNDHPIAVRHERNAGPPIGVNEISGSDGRRVNDAFVWLEWKIGARSDDDPAVWRYEA